AARWSRSPRPRANRSIWATCWSFSTKPGRKTPFDDEKTATGESVLDPVLLGVDDGDAGEIDDVLDLVASLEDVDGFVHADEHRSDRFGTTQSLEEFVADVTRFEIGEDEDVGGFVQLREVVGSIEHLLDDGGV